METNEFLKINHKYAELATKRSKHSWRRALWYGGQSKTARVVGGLNRVPGQAAQAAGKAGGAVGGLAAGVAVAGPAGALPGALAGAVLVPAIEKVAEKLGAAGSAAIGDGATTGAGWIKHKVQLRRDDIPQMRERVLAKELGKLKSETIVTIDRNVQKLEGAQRAAKAAIQKFDRCNTIQNADEKAKRAHDALQAWHEADYYNKKLRILVKTVESALTKVDKQLDDMDRSMNEQSERLRKNIMLWC